MLLILLFCLLLLAVEVVQVLLNAEDVWHLERVEALQSQLLPDLLQVLHFNCEPNIDGFPQVIAVSSLVETVVVALDFEPLTRISHIQETSGMPKARRRTKVQEIKFFC